MTAHLPGLGIKIIVVLDDTPADRSLGATLLSWYGRDLPELKVHYEALPPNAETLFQGNRHLGGSRSPGQDRAEWSMFYADKYVGDAEIIGHFDAEVCFLAPPVPRVTDGRLHNIVQLGYPTGDKYFTVDSLAVGLTTLVGAMDSEVFPLYMWRDDHPRVRAHVARTVCGPEGCNMTSMSNAFDAAFSHLSGLPPFVWGATYSGFNIMFNAAIHFNPFGYTCHAATFAFHELKGLGHTKKSSITVHYSEMPKATGMLQRALDVAHATHIQQALPGVAITTRAFFPASTNHNAYGMWRGMQEMAVNKMRDGTLDNYAEIGVWCCARFAQLGCDAENERLPLRLPPFMQLAAQEHLTLVRERLASRSAEEQHRSYMACTRAISSLPPMWPLRAPANLLKDHGVPQWHAWHW